MKCARSKKEYFRTEFSWDFFRRAPLPELKFHEPFRRAPLPELKFHENFFVEHRSPNWNFMSLFRWAPLPELKFHETLKFHEPFSLSTASRLDHYFSIFSKVCEHMHMRGTAFAQKSVPPSWSSHWMKSFAWWSMDFQRTLSRYLLFQNCLLLAFTSPFWSSVSLRVLENV